VTAPLVARRVLHFPDPMDKARWLDEAASIDAQRPYVRDVALRLAREIDPNDHAQLAREILRFTENAIHYVHDPSAEEFADVETILKRGADDCDGKARTFVALCRSVGLKARIRPVFQHGKFTHVQGEVRFPGSERDSLAEEGGWLVCDPIVRGARLGQAPPDIPKEGGAWRLV
jgi:transglutaminase-like putative cysteine protease